MKKSVLKQYARLIARTGANVQKGQSVLIVAGLDQPEFIELLAAECYRAGVSEVEVEWRHQPLTRLAVRYKSAKKLGEVLTGSDPDTISVVVGSEGGFSPEEARFAGECGLTVTGLGTRILRCETAPVFVLSCISFARELC